MEGKRMESGWPFFPPEIVQVAFEIRAFRLMRIGPGGFSP